jgi:CheY-like chemotaxis protein
VRTDSRIFHRISDFRAYTEVVRTSEWNPSMNDADTAYRCPGPDSIPRPVILVIDDTKVIHTVIDTIFAGFEGTILHAYNGADGFRMARAIHPEVLLTDALLPGLDGRDVVRLLKSDPSTAGIRSIVMTALYKGARYRNEAFSNFLCDEYIEKPVSAARLRAVVAEMLSKSASTEREALAS